MHEPVQKVDQLIKTLSKKHNISEDLIREMLLEEREVRHLKRRRGIKDRLRTIIERSIGGDE